MDDAQHIAGFNAGTLAQIPAQLQQVVDQGALSGFVTLVWRGGKDAQLATVGLRDIAAGAPMQRDTLFRIASMSKPVTSLAIMMLMDEGKLRLDDPIKKWLPEFSDMRVMKDPAGELSDTYPAPRDITVDDLLTHRAGLAYAFSAQGPLAKAYDQRLGAATGIGSPHAPDAWLEALGGLPLMFPPGERMHYSHATDVLGFLLARIDGKTLGESLKHRIFDPLGMVDTGFWVEPAKRHRMAHLYRLPAAGGPLQDVSHPFGDTPQAFESGGGGLISTADDYLKFARLMLGRGAADGVRLLKPETVDLMTANHLTPAQRQLPFLGMPYWESMGFGLGVSVIMDPAKHEAMGAGGKGTFGWPGAFGTWWQADPVNDTILIYLIQDSVDLSPGAITGERQVSAGRMMLATFQKLAYAALA